MLLRDVSQWNKSYSKLSTEAFPGNGKRMAHDEEVWRLKTQLHQRTQEQERDIQRRGAGLVRQRAEVMLGAVAQSEREAESARIETLIAEVHEASRVARLMRARGLRGRTWRRYRTTTKADARHPVAENLLKRDFTAAGPDQVWVGEQC